MKKILLAIINAFFRLFPIDPKKVLFISTNYQLNDNPYAVFRYMKEHTTGYKLIYLVARGTDVSGLQKGEYTYVRSLMSLYHLATYKYRFTCQSYGSIIQKRPGQRYIQLWHGTYAIKKMGFDVGNPEGLTQLPHTMDWDYYIGASDADVALMRGCSGFTCPAMVLGNPRTDVLFSAWDTQAIRQRLGITSEKKILLYAPTFRDWELDADKVFLPPLEALAEEYTVLLRLHPFVAHKVDPAIFNDSIRNACQYPNVNELLAVADVLVTDYSSIFIDFSLMGKPTVFYVYDHDRYGAERGFYLDFNTQLPGPAAYTQEELFRHLGGLTPDLEKIRQFNQKYATRNDGGAAKRVVEALQNGLFDR